MPSSPSMRASISSCNTPRSSRWRSATWCTGRCSRAGPQDLAKHGHLHRRLERVGRRGAAQAGHRLLLRADAGVGPARCQRGEHHRGGGRAGGGQARRAARAQRPSSWPAPVPSASGRPGCWPGKGRRSASRPARSTRPSSFAIGSSSSCPEPSLRPPQTKSPADAAARHRRRAGRHRRRCGRRRAALRPNSSRAASRCKVAIDLNAVPPAGIAGIDVMDKAKDRDGVVCYGAIGVGGTKMKIHRAAIAEALHGQQPGARRRRGVCDRPGAFIGRTCNPFGIHPSLPNSPCPRAP